MYNFFLLIFMNEHKEEYKESQGYFFCMLLLLLKRFCIKKKINEIC